jgi:hypothetical protein
VRKTLLMVRIICLVLPLWGGRVGARHPQLGAFRQEEGPDGRVVKLTSVVILYSFDSAAELSSNISKKMNNVVKVSDFCFSRKIHK